MTMDQDDPLFDEKYLVLKRDELPIVLEHMAHGFTKDHAAGVLEQHRVDDAVVVRRQDLIAAPVLGCYANILAAMVKTLGKDDNPNRAMMKSLTNAGDYFDRQAEAAAEEGWKLPD